MVYVPVGDTDIIRGRGSICSMKLALFTLGRNLI